MHPDAPEPMAEALISLQHLQENARLISKKAGVPLMAVVKANAYGHGAREVSRALLAEGIEHFGVANIHEAIELRAGGSLPRPAAILSFASPLPSQIPSYLQHGIEMTVCDPATLRAAEAAASGTGTTIGIHLKVDTGMGRLGLPPAEALRVLQELPHCPHVELKGIYTHFADSSGDRAFTRKQLEAFRAFSGEYEHATGRRVLKHAANSGAILSEPDAMLDMVRPGILLYGCHPSSDTRERLEVQPVMQVEARVVFLKTVTAGTTISYNRTWKAPGTRKIATIAAGYADGYHRSLSGKATVSINGTAYPQIGTVTMDQIMIDLGAESDVRVGDRAVLFGWDGMRAEELASRAGTISYELLSAVSSRVLRSLV
ncbi:MAG: alanine racemase [Pelodictyon luteolum]|uniref:Alanine racemase n=1 Tax=Pelodictyon luteolum TaxID=1100 RepID=A0A165L1K3_PELLU|nr:alanine racemase [Pelodictyon luteolum]KZK73454.1 MAG: alanine racemase [Pelodictyon luteolum]